MKLFALVIATVLVLSSTAQAGILLDPYLGYGLGKYEATGTGGEKGDANAAALGARVGGTFAMLFIGADYSMTLGGKTDPDGGAAGEDFDKSDLYAVIGADLPLIRAWVGYGLMNSLELKPPGAASTEFSGGTNFKAGVGLKIIPMVSINLEYIMNDYKKLKSGGVEVTLPNAGGLQEVTSNTVFLSASVPFTF